MKIVSIALAATLGLATAGYAGGITVPAADPEVTMTEPMATGADWGGFYAGATYGIGIGGDMEYDPGFIYGSLEPGSSYGAFAGYNIQRNNLVYGGEIAYSRVDVPGFGASGFPDENFDYFIDGKARVGYAMNNVLVYGFAGYSWSNFLGFTNSWEVSGLNYGVGADVMFGENLFVGAEFIVRNLSGETNNPGQIHTTNIQAAQLRAGWKF